MLTKFVGQKRNQSWQQIHYSAGNQERPTTRWWWWRRWLFRPFDLQENKRKHWIFSPQSSSRITPDLTQGEICCRRFLSSCSLFSHRYKSFWLKYLSLLSRKKWHFDFNIWMEVVICYLKFYGWLKNVLCYLQLKFRACTKGVLHKSLFRFGTRTILTLGALVGRGLSHNLGD